MNNFFLGLVAGIVLGTVLTIIVTYIRGRFLLRNLESRMRETFLVLATEALDANSRRLAEQTGVTLDGKKELIDQSVKQMSERLECVRQLLSKIETDRKADFGRLTTSVSSLAATAGDLHEMLASSKRRGAWGERMAEDILRLVGLSEGINYSRQSSEQAESGRPDFTFFLPNDLVVNMDVKFPLEAYKEYLDAETEQQRQDSVKQIVSSVRGHIRDVAGRGYIEPSVTVSYVIIFVPSEQIYNLALSAQADLIDEALERKIVLASPITLYAMLAVIRQAAESVNIMRTADEVIGLLNDFYKRWYKYNEELDKLGQRIDQTSKQYDTVRTTRTSMLQKPLDKLDDLRQKRELEKEDT